MNLAVNVSTAVEIHACGIFYSTTLSKSCLNTAAFSGVYQDNIDQQPVFRGKIQVKKQAKTSTLLGNMFCIMWYILHTRN